MSQAVWEDPESVARFAGRDPDLRLLEILDAVDDPGSLRVLDLGCAAGRNTAVLAERGFDFHALDGSRAMIEHTRGRAEGLVGAAQAARRVHHGRMDDLSRFDAESFDLVIALGVFHCAASGEEWHRAVAEAARVLAPGGRLLVAVFTPETDLHGRGIEPVPDEPNVYSGFSSGRTFLLDRASLDRAMAGQSRQVSLFGLR